MPVLALLLSASGVSRPPSDLDRAWDLAGKGQAPEAIALLRELVQKQPANAEPRLLLGSLLMEAGDCRGSTEQLTEAKRLQPRSSEAANALGETERSCGDPAAALADFKQAVAYNPNYALGQLNLGQALLDTQNEKEAAVHLDKAIRLLGKKDDAADAHYLRAKIWANAGAQGQAAAELQAAVAIRPGFAQAWSDLGYALQQLGQDANAVAALKKAIAAAPDDAVAQYRLGAEYSKMHDARSAIPPLQAAYRLSPQDQSTLNALQTALRADGRTAEADAVKAELRQLLRDRDRQSQNALAAVRLNNEGSALEKAGNLPGALAKYHEAFVLAPDHNGIRINYAVALLRTGRWTEGLNQLHEAAKREPANAEVQTALRDALSQAPPGSVPRWTDAPAR